GISENLLLKNRSGRKPGIRIAPGAIVWSLRSVEGPARRTFQGRDQTIRRWHQKTPFRSERLARRPGRERPTRWLRRWPSENFHNIRTASPGLSRAAKHPLSGR